MINNFFNKCVYFLNQITIFSLSLFLVLNAKSGEIPPHTLVLFENDHFRNFTFDELKNKIVQNTDLIDLNRCDGSENQVFPQMKKNNSQKNSLRIQSPLDLSLITYIDGQLFNSKMKLVNLNSIKDSYSRQIIQLLNQLRGTVSGKKLIDSIQKSIYPIVIIKDGGPRFEAVAGSGKNYSGYEEATAIQHFVTLRKSGEEAIEFKKIGAGGRLRFDPSKTFTNIESDLVKRITLPVVTLGHEMYHAFDSVRGLLDRRYADGETMEFNEVGEFRATYFENQIRKELGRKYRKFYGQDIGSKSLLDKNNEPYLLPTPCIK